MNRKSFLCLCIILIVLQTSFLPIFRITTINTYSLNNEFPTNDKLISIQTEDDWIAYSLPWNDGTPSALDNRYLLPEFAGEKGYLEVGNDGHFYFQEDNSRAKFWGTNICWGGCFPDYDDAEIIANRLAKFGFNLVRFHKFDTEHVERGNIFSKDFPNDSRHIDPEKLDRFDYFIYQLKQNGIHILIDLHAERGFKEGDNVIGGNPDGRYEWIPQAAGGWVNSHGKFITIFNQTFIDLQQEFAENLLTHLNPYTGFHYVNDPAIALIEITNENSMFLGYVHDYIFEHVRDGDVPNSSDIHPYYLEQLDILWNNWLQDKYGTISNLQTYWNIGQNLPDSSNLLLNGGFESNLNNWNFNIPIGWSANAEIDFNNKVEGSSSVKITVTSKDSGGINSLNLTQQLNSLTKDENYYLTFWAKATKFGSKIQPLTAFGFWDWGPEIYVGEEWRLYYCTLKAIGTSGELCFNLGEIQEGQSIWIDNVKLQQGGVFGLRTEESWDNNNISRNEYRFRRSYTWNRFKDEMNFYADLDYQYGMQMHSFLTSIGVKTPITVTNGYYGFASVPGRYEPSDYLDAHVYWDPPYAHHNYNWGSNYAGVMDGGFIYDLMFLGFKNKPLTVSEWNFLFPQKTQYQGPIMVSSYAAFQEVDALMIFDFYWNTSEIDLRANFIPGEYSIACNPSMMFQAFVGSRLFLRDVAPADSTLFLNYSMENIYQNMNRSNGYVPIYYPYTVDNNYCYIHGLRLNITELIAFESVLEGKSSIGEINSKDISALSPPFISDTNEIYWNPLEEFFYVNTSRTKVLLGLLGGDIKNVGNLQFTSSSAHGSIALLSLDGKTTSQSEHLLLVAQSSSRNHNMNLTYSGEMPRVWNVEKWGTSPPEILLLKGETTIEFDGDISEDTISIFALDETGERFAQLSFTTTTNPLGGIQVTFYIGDNNQTCYEIIIGEIPQTQISSINPNPVVAEELIQFIGESSNPSEIARYMWGIKQIEQASSIIKSKEKLTLKNQFDSTNIVIPNKPEETYVVFSWEREAALILNDTGIYQIYFKAQGKNGVWSNLSTVILIVNEEEQQNRPFLFLAWTIPIIVIVVTTTTVIIILKLRKKRE
ncbi:MAG: cellulase family glycosylhydrolase [Asgard group archaeon]|nr:cellulase family glycosylhydrolase [Asgard group archaeon]